MQRPDKGFKRGTGPLVSILLPTRGRPHFLYGALDSLFTLAHRPDQLEVLLKVDEDDKETQEACHHISTKFPVRVFVSPRGRGYLDIHLWQNQMTEYATGDWIFIFNDDARMLTAGWDSIIEGCRGGFEDEIMMFGCHTISRPGSCELFLVRRKVHEVLGHLFLSPHGDTWMLSIMQMLQRIMFCPIQVCHFNDAVGDATAVDRKNQCNAHLAQLHDLNLIRAKMNDVETLLKHMEKFLLPDGSPA